MSGETRPVLNNLIREGLFSVGVASSSVVNRYSEDILNFVAMHNSCPLRPRISGRLLIKVVDIDSSRSIFHLICKPDGVTREKVVSDHLVYVVSVDSRLSRRSLTCLSKVDKVSCVSDDFWKSSKSCIHTIIKFIQSYLRLFADIKVFCKVVNVPIVSWKSNNILFKLHKKDNG